MLNILNIKAMKKTHLILTSLIVGLIFFSCEKHDSLNPKLEYVVIDSNDKNVSELFPNEVVKPEITNTTNKDGSYIFDFEKDNLWDVEILAINNESNNIYKGIGIRNIPNESRLTYVSLNPMNESDTINNKINWVLLRSTEITMLVNKSNMNNPWSDFKYLAIRQYFQNQNINKYYWIKFRIDNSITEYEIDSFFK